jgi:deoxyribonuclease V
MMFPALHRWPDTTRAAIALQQRLAPQVRLEPLARELRLLAGADVAFSADGQDVIAGVVVWDWHTRALVEQCVVRARCRFPYVPGLLSFRELPGVLAAFRRLRTRPDAVLCDGQGLAHPRRLGLACHLGLWLGIPTVGCAKSRLCGTYDEPGPRRGDAAPLVFGGEQVGVVLRTRDHVKPLFVSPGQHCDFAGAVQLTLAAALRYRLPEPTRLAHQLVTAARRGAESG